MNDVELLEKTLQDLGNDIACIIIEPIPANNGLLLQDISYLKAIRKLCDNYGVLLIFDEVISGFRVGFEGAAGYYDIQPDIITYGKIIGGGMPVGAYGASQKLMSHIAPEGSVYQAGTLSANPVAMAAGYAALKQLLEEDFYSRLETKTKSFVKQIQEFCNENNYPVTISTVGSIFWVAFTNERIFSADQIDPESMERFKVLHHELLQKGIYLGPSGYEVGFVSAAHEEKDLNEAAAIICECMSMVYS